MAEQERIRVLVLGSAGNMGRRVGAAVQAAEDLALVGGVDTVAAPDFGAPSFTDLARALAATRPDVAVDFTVAEAARHNLPALLEHGVAAVVGTTGLDDSWLDTLAEQARQQGVSLLVAANFALGAVLMMRFAAQAARWFESAEIIEYHHDRKRDAPSGTAAATLAAMVEARGGDFAAPKVDETETLSGARGGQRGRVHVHSVRLPGLVADQDVLLGGPGETLRLSHRTIDRDCFMPGVLLAVRRVRALPAGLTRGLDALLLPD